MTFSLMGTCMGHGLEGHELASSWMRYLSLRCLHLGHYHHEGAHEMQEANCKQRS
jgi:hypothetical protein